eukprot:6470910-Amphidinium_carterae.1
MGLSTSAYASSTDSAACRAYSCSGRTPHNHTSHTKRREYARSLQAGHATATRLGHLHAATKDHPVPRKEPSSSCRRVLSHLRLQRGQLHHTSLMSRQEPGKLSKLGQPSSQGLRLHMLPVLATSRVMRVCLEYQNPQGVWRVDEQWGC